MKATERVEVVCPACESSLWLAASRLGGWVRCPACGLGFATDPGPLPDVSERWDDGEACIAAVHDVPGRRSGRGTVVLVLALISAVVLGSGLAVYVLCCRV
jgi:hypothetical protein